MFKVECEGCSAPYEIDERRVPAAGLKMRCPKCGASFLVRKPEGEGDAALPAVPPAKPAAPPNMPQPKPAPRAAAPAPAAPAAPVAARAVAAPAVATGGDLPVSAGKGPPRAPVPPAPRAAPAAPAAPRAPAAPLGAVKAPAAPAASPPRAPPAPNTAAAPRAPAPPRAPIAAAPVAIPSIEPDADDDLEMEIDLPAAVAPVQVPKSPPKPTGIGFGTPAVKSPAGPAIGAITAKGTPAGSPIGAIATTTVKTTGVGTMGGAGAMSAKSKAGNAAPAFGEIDLPSPTAGKVSTPRPAPFALSSAPPRTAGQRAAMGDDDDLPAVLSGKAFGGAVASSAPSPAPDSTPSAGLPAVFAGLPAPGGGAGLPMTSSGGAALPAAKARSTAFGEIDLPLLSPEPPVLSAPLPSPRAPSPPPPAAPAAASLPPFSLASDPPAVSAPPEEVDEADLLEGSLPPALGGSVQRAGGGGTSFGELDLGGEEDLGEALIGFDAPKARSVPAPGSPSLGSPAAGSNRPLRAASVPAPAGEEDMEFGGIPQAAEGAAPGLAPVAPAKPRDEAPPSAKPKKASKVGRVIAGLLAVSILGGASLEVLTPMGAFGRHAILDLLNRDKLAALQTQTIDGARKLLATDTFTDANRALAQVDAAHASTPRLSGLLAYGAFVGYVVELRYGRGPQIDAHAKQQLAQIPPDATAPFLELARAAEAGVESQLPRAKQIAESLAQREPQNVDVAILAGEVELLVKEPQKALDSFNRAASIDGASARSTFGIARAEGALGKQEASNKQAENVLKQSPHHVGARLLLARSAWTGTRDETVTRNLLTEIVSPGPTRDAASPLELVDALTLVARVHMARSRMTQAESALAEALKIDPKAGPALAGMGELLYREGRYTDALARFEAGIQADPEGIAAKIGAAKTKIALERLQEAKEQLKKLRDARPGDVEVVYWLGRAEDALGDKPAAEKAYGEAIALAPTKPEVVQAYVALSQLLASQGRPADAQAKLAEAKAALPPSAAIYHAIGDVELVSGRYDEAREEYEAALKSEADDLASRFKLGVTFRRMNRFDEAQAEFDKVSALDKDYPGLALERGLLFEASNRTREALAFYQQALAKAPDDPDMMLRVGSAEVVAGQASQAEEVLRKVIGKRPNSAEVNHYLGRALLLKGTNLAEALRYLKRSVEIDPNRAEYHLYVGWAANEAGQPAVAQEELTKALALDKGLADAYWQIGVMQRKQGAVIDAMKNLQKALELRPSRFEAYATLAECYEDENKIGEAILSWRKAIAADATRPEWHYRLGKLMGRAGEGELREAVTLSEARDTKPGWLAQAYFELAESERGSGRRADAVQHYRKFVALAKVDSPYRGEAIKWLGALGAPYDPNAP